MLITVVEATSENKGKYNKLTVKYQNDKGQSNGKDVMSFGKTKDTYLVLSQAKAGDQYEIKSEKNDKGFWDWVEAKKVGHGEVNVKTVSKAPESRFETPEERAARQILIIRQSSLSTAVEYLNHVKKSYELGEIINVAGQFEEYVTGKSSTAVASYTESGYTESDEPNL